MKDKTFIEEQFKKEGITLTLRQACQFYDYYELLVEWNEKINLTSITEFEDVVIKHFVDSLGIVKMFSSFEEAGEFLKGKTLCDVGTGAGFPGIPLKILFPELKVYLFDSLDKRINFLNEVINKLSLEDIVAVHGRAEDLAREKEYREFFDISTARAVASLSVLSEYCVPFVKVGGLFTPYKSEKTSIEIEEASNALKVLGCEVENAYEFSLDDGKLLRTIIKIRKVAATSDKYPRRAGVPTKKPL